MRVILCAFLFAILLQGPGRAASPPCWAPSGFVLPNYGVCGQCITSLAIDDQCKVTPWTDRSSGQTPGWPLVSAVIQATHVCRMGSARLIQEATTIGVAVRTSHTSLVFAPRSASQVCPLNPRRTTDTSMGTQQYCLPKHAILMRSPAFFD